MIASTRMRSTGRAARFVILTAALLASSLAPALAHPSLMMTYRVLFNFENGLVNGIGEAWTFDPQFSSRLISDCDVDGDGHFSSEETEDLRKNAFSTLSDFRYFTFISVDENDIGPPDPVDFQADIAGDRVRFAFGVRLPSPVDPAKRKVAIELRDEDYVIFLNMAEDHPAYVRGSGSESCKSDISEDVEAAMFGGAMVPQKISLVCR